MSAGELDYLLQRLFGLINLDEALTITACALIAVGASPLTIREGRAALWLWLQNFARSRSMATFTLLPIGLALLYIL